MDRCEFLRYAMKSPDRFLKYAKILLDEVENESWKPPESNTNLLDAPLHFGEWFHGDETWNGIKNYELDRLTDPNGSYCKDKCGMYNSCTRVKEKNFCRDVIMYEKLKLYENTGLTPAFVEMVFQAYSRVITEMQDGSKIRNMGGGE